MTKGELLQRRFELTGTRCSLKRFVRDLAILKTYETNGLTIKDIASRFHVSPRTVDNALKRTRWLRKALGDEWDL